jgi:hypothetical protein
LNDKLRVLPNIGRSEAIRDTIRPLSIDTPGTYFENEPQKHNLPSTVAAKNHYAK